MRSLAIYLFVAALLPSTRAQRLGVPTDDLTKLGVDELFSVEVTSVGKKAQKLSKAPAAVFVISEEDIRRSGATSIPEALQGVPGLTVLKIDDRNWVVSARGSAHLYSNKMLVLIDGRSLYTPLFASVMWDWVDLPLETIEQIEIVRGPGAVMWGPNAVNGVINIITKSAKPGEGGSVSTSVGNELRSASMQWTSGIGSHTAVRVWGKAEDRTPAFGSPGFNSFAQGIPFQGAPVEDLDTESGRVGFRIDSELTKKDALLLAGDAYRSGRQDALDFIRVQPNITDRVQSHSDLAGGFFQAKWTRSHSPGEETSLQFAYDRNNIDYGFIGSEINNLTIDLQHTQRTSDRNEVYWGAGVQQYWDDSYSLRGVAMSPGTSSYRDGNAVFRDEYQLMPDRLTASAGMRLDYNSYSHFEWQPSFKLLYTPDKVQSAWIGWSRAVRVPSRYDRDLSSSGGIVVENGLPISIQAIGSRSMVAEIEKSWEAGYRYQYRQRWSIDGSVFWSDYKRLRALRSPLLPTVDVSGPAPVFSISAVEVDRGSGRASGLEIWGAHQVRSGWRLLASYSYLNEDRWLPADGLAQYMWDGMIGTLRHQAMARSQYDINRWFQLDLTVRGRSRNVGYQLPGVLLADAHVSWRPTRSGEMSFTVQDITNRQVLEAYAEGPFAAIPLRRTFIAKWVQRF